MRYVTRNEGYDGPTHDFVEVVDRGDVTVIALADGAGSSGDDCARSVLRIARAIENPRDAFEIARRIASVGERHGESTAVVIACFEGGIAGASVGDSGAWLMSGKSWFDLTSAQERKPLVGLMTCKPIPFYEPVSAGTLLVASDGLFKYAKAEQIRELAAQADLDTAAAALVASVRFQSGRLADDVAVVLCRF